jgi:type III secretion system (T3SS) SseB-like protein
MLPTDPSDRPGSSLPGGRPPGPPEGTPFAQPRPDHELAAQPLRDIVPPHGTTIIRPGAVAWGGLPDAKDGGYSSCEALERALAAVTRNPGELPGLLAELAPSRLWVPLPHRPFTDGTAVRLPLIGYEGADFVPCFTSVQRLNAWAGRDWQRAGDARQVPHVVLPAIGLARRLPSGVGLAINPDSSPGLPLFPECVPYLARLTAPAILGLAGTAPPGGLAMEHIAAGTGPRLVIGHPPAEPSALLAETRSALRALPFVRQAARAWLSVPGEGEGLLISVLLDDPASERAQTAVTDAIEQATAAVALRVPFPVDLIFPGEAGTEAVPDAIDAWIADNTRPFYHRGDHD